MRSQGPYEIDDSPDRVDLDAVWQFLSAEAYWSRWRSRDDVQRQSQAAWRVVGCYDGQGHMVGFARALSDGAALAYLADVYVLENHRGRGLGRALLQEMIEDSPGKEFRWLLHTADAHGLYRQFGFTAPDATIMERASRRPTATNPPGAKPLAAPLLGQCAAPGRPEGSGLVPVPAGTAPNAPPGMTRRLARGITDRIRARSPGTDRQANGSGRPDRKKRRKHRSQGGSGKCDQTERVTPWPLTAAASLSSRRPPSARHISGNARHD